MATAKHRAYRVRCHLCLMDFTVPFKSREDGAWDVYQRILDGHREVSPSCRGGRDDLQIIRGGRARRIRRKDLEGL